MVRPNSKSQKMKNTKFSRIASRLCLIPAAQGNGDVANSIDQGCEIHECNDKKPKIKLKTPW